MPDTPSRPDPFLEVRVHHSDLPSGLTGLCAGYEEGVWRCKQLASHLIEWLPSFALSHEEQRSLQAHNAVHLVASAARSVYSSPRYQNRGEIGELLLHVAISQQFKSVPAISKYYYKDSSNDTVKGFDAVHVVVDETSLELWLGEVKYYKSIDNAIRDVIKELNEHTKREYLRAEFAAITNKIDAAWPHADRLKGLIHRNQPLDKIFDRLCIPVFLTYESSTIANHQSASTEFEDAIRKEFYRHHAAFCERLLPREIRIHLFLLPLKDKESLSTEFDKRLRACQNMI